MPFGRVDGWVSGKNRDQFSMTQKHLNMAGDEGAERRGAVGGNRKDPTVRNLLAFDSVEKTNQSTWFHGMWTAGKKRFGFVTGCLVNGVTNEKHFQA